jgi:hypothetical protein
MSKKEKTQLVLVETISQFRMRYVVEVPVGIDQYGNDKTLWALDTVTCEEAREFSQEFIGETIVSHRSVSQKEALKIFDIDHGYLKNWDKNSKLRCVTSWEEQQKEKDS